MGSMSENSEDKERPQGIAGVISGLEHAQDFLSLIVGVLLVALAAVVLVVGVVDFFRGSRMAAGGDRGHRPAEPRVLVLILVEILHTVVLSLRAHHLVTQPLLAVGLVAVIRQILFVLSSEETVSTTELALLIAMIIVFVAALILISRYGGSET